ncbi:hypothetical protein [Nitrospirillum viridazoti]|uniref:Uncharacterized protein n=1 Tax=Nitrospirillum amazonense TaxID=28077 RepID=A0A560IKW5_9PROT|nr:hypothetical protein [Nitrospirillum amazonense]TWB58699.1 hypothetical protein FBZ92_109192 [Nitrospirillum amazonense]
MAKQVTWTGKAGQFNEITLDLSKVLFIEEAGHHMDQKLTRLYFSKTEYITIYEAYDTMRARFQEATSKG